MYLEKGLLCTWSGWYIYMITILCLFLNIFLISVENRIELKNLILNTFKSIFTIKTLIWKDHIQRYNFSFKGVTLTQWKALDSQSKVRRYSSRFCQTIYFKKFMTGSDSSISSVGTIEQPLTIDCDFLC